MKYFILVILSLIVLSTNVFASGLVLTPYSESKLISLETGSWHRWLLWGGDNYNSYVKRFFKDGTVITDKFNENNKHYFWQIERSVDGIKITDSGYKPDRSTDKRIKEYKIGDVLFIDEYSYGNFDDIYKRTRKYYDPIKRVDIVDIDYGADGIIEGEIRSWGSKYYKIIESEYSSGSGTGIIGIADSRDIEILKVQAPEKNTKVKMTDYEADGIIDLRSVEYERDGKKICLTYNSSLNSECSPNIDKLVSESTTKTIGNVTTTKYINVYTREVESEETVKKIGNTTVTENWQVGDETYMRVTEEKHVIDFE